MRLVEQGVHFEEKTVFEQDMQETRLSLLSFCCYFSGDVINCCTHFLTNLLNDFTTRVNFKNMY